MKFSLRKRNFYIVFVGILLILSLNLYRDGIKNFFYFFSQPIQKFFWKSGNETSDFFSGILKTRELKKHNEELSIENQRLLGEITKLLEFQKENEILRKALGIELQKDFNLVFAQVIGKDTSQDIILINKGLRDGISSGMPVVTEGKVLLGEIEDPADNFSKVLLVSHTQNSFDVKIQGKEITGLVKGKGDLKLLLDLVPKDQEIKEGELVETSSLGGIFPKGILVGKIEKIMESDVKPFQQAEVSSLFNVPELGTVFIITNY